MSHHHEIKIKIRRLTAVGLTVDEPQPGETMHTPFEAYGTVEPPGTPVTAAAQSKSTGKRYAGTPMAPPLDDNWAFQFDVPAPDDYVVLVRANGLGDSIDPVHVN